jgi:uncharacterized protein YjiS (DUF1127 family)
MLQVEKQMSNVTDCHALVDRPADRLRFGLGHLPSILKTVWRQYRNRRGLNDLLSWSDYQLKDIGLQRGDIQREALKPLWGA